MCIRDSIWTYRPVIEAVVDIGELEDFPSNTIPGFYERLTGLLPSLIDHRCSYGERGGFLRRVAEGTWPAHILEPVSYTHLDVYKRQLLPLPIIGWLIHVVREKLRTGFERVDRVWAEVTNVLADTIPGIRVVKAFAQEKREAARFRAANAHNLEVNDRVNKVWSVFSPTVTLPVSYTHLDVYKRQAVESLVDTGGAGLEAALPAEQVDRQQPAIAQA